MASSVHDLVRLFGGGVAKKSPSPTKISPVATNSPPVIANESEQTPPIDSEQTPEPHEAEKILPAPPTPEPIVPSHIRVGVRLPGFGTVPKLRSTMGDSNILVESPPPSVSNPFPPSIPSDSSSSSQTTTPSKAVWKPPENRTGASKGFVVDVLNPGSRHKVYTVMPGSVDGFSASIWSAAEGDTIVLAPGKYILKDVLEINKSLKFEGRGASNLDTTLIGGPLRLWGGSTRGTLRNLQLSGEVRVLQGKWLLENCAIVPPPLTVAGTFQAGIGISVRSEADVLIKDCTLAGFVTGISVGGSSVAGIIHNDISNCEVGLGVDVEGGGQVATERNVLKDCKQAMLVVDGCVDKVRHGFEKDADCFSGCGEEIAVTASRPWHESDEVVPERVRVLPSGLPTPLPQS
mmetsp:Transcript_34568/g.55908  ORF Transcript_34568/g.55908 Transcript_34568/m.55908 type:complete len:404 (-) Transcript_34568:555-1766(-)|eukprot:CAMPEP_0184665696 /NCGR_PEP_ID=MMETSP0308-20130426/58253_1 /TAXON_ID=38269 /ORGANISM="Gloeochaete witrockiana, Strain SAG 46.84" /LENGTH=403 /DNA_ID=CAMNT_0027109847 /DNA_START=96 /DNA_END=1307 /DNA_ORIENTATION=+